MARRRDVNNQGRRLCAPRLAAFRPFQAASGMFPAARDPNGIAPGLSRPATSSSSLPAHASWQPARAHLIPRTPSGHSVMLVPISVSLAGML